MALATFTQAGPGDLCQVGETAFLDSTLPLPWEASESSDKLQPSAFSLFSPARPSALWGKESFTLLFLVLGTEVLAPEYITVGQK